MNLIDETATMNPLLYYALSAVAFVYVTVYWWSVGLEPYP